MNKENELTSAQKESIAKLAENKDFETQWKKMHTPWKNTSSHVGRNDICPYCDSGKKFKNCNCYKTKKNEYTW